MVARADTVVVRDTGAWLQFLSQQAQVKGSEVGADRRPDFTAKIGFVSRVVVCLRA